MKVGFNLLLWTPFVEEKHFGILGKLKATGYDGVEVPLFGGDVPHYKKVAQALKDNGLKCTTCTVMPDEEHNPISAEAKHRQGAVEYLKWVIDCNAALGSEVLAGPFYQPFQLPEVLPKGSVASPAHGTEPEGFKRPPGAVGKVLEGLGKACDFTKLQGEITCRSG